MGTTSLDTLPEKSTANAATTSATMTSTLDCREFDQLLSEVLVRSELPPAAQQHLADCAACAAILDDFEAIAERVRQLPGPEMEEVPDLWPDICDVLRREGLIHAEGQACTPPAPVLVRRGHPPGRS